MKRLISILAVLCASCAPHGRVVNGALEGVAPGQEVTPVQQASDLETGKRVYDLHCARCHGRDGKDKGYPFIATLDGIGKRMTPEEILRATWATGFVSERQFTEEERRGLGAYVASL